MFNKWFKNKKWYHIFLILTLVMFLISPGLAMALSINWV